MKLTIKQGTAVEVENGYVEMDGPTVTLMALLYKGTKDERRELVVAYHMLPGETVRRIKEGEYEVQY